MWLLKHEAVHMSSHRTKAKDLKQALEWLLCITPFLKMHIKDMFIKSSTKNLEEYTQYYFQLIFVKSNVDRPLRYSCTI